MENNITELMTQLVFQLAVIIFAVRIFGKLAVKVGIPSVLGELIAGIVIGPYAFGAVALPGFANGLFPLNSASLAVRPELYSFSIIASIILLFSSGLETDLKLFLKYSLSGGIIGFGGVAVSFLLGNIVTMVMLKTSFMDVRCLFLGIMSTATSVGITARILSDRKKMDSPEGVTILAAAVFDDVLGIVLLAVVMGIVSAVSGGSSLSGQAVALIALKAFSIWLFFTALCIVLSKKIAQFAKLFGGGFDFTIAAFGVALILSGIFEKQGLAMIIGAYTTGLALSGTEIAPIIQEKIHGIYKFFVPIFFAVMGMSVNIQELTNPAVLKLGFVYTVFALAAKILGCGGPALGLGFNMKGALRIGAGMVPRGEVALIIAGIGLTAGVINQELFGVVILMTLFTTLVAPPLLNILLGTKGRGTRKEVKSSESQQFIWDFGDTQIAMLIFDLFVTDLRKEGFYVQMMNISDGLTQARKGDVALSISMEGSKLNIQTAAEDMGFVKGAIYEAVLSMNNSLRSLEAIKNSNALQQGLISSENRVNSSLMKILSKNVISTDLHAENKDEVLEELVWLLEKSGKVLDHKEVLADIKAREKIMSTGLENGIALPHAKSNGVKDICVAIGVKKDGIDFGAMDEKKSKIFIMIVSPKTSGAPQMQAMAAVTGVLQKTDGIEKILSAKSSQEILRLFTEIKK